MEGKKGEQASQIEVRRGGEEIEGREGRMHPEMKLEGGRKIHGRDAGGVLEVWRVQQC